MSYIVIQTSVFERCIKKLHADQKEDLFKAIQTIVINPNIGRIKVGDLQGLRVYKFKMSKQEMLLAYKLSSDLKEIWLHYLDSHQNFYRDLKKIIN